jgi:predicted nuclease of predicted toxin-antitoxin system
MKLIFDQNLSPHLVQRLDDLFPGSAHVQSLGLDCASDDEVWEFAKLDGLAIVTKDEDYNNSACCAAFRQRSFGCSWATAPQHKSKESFVTVSLISISSKKTNRSAL